MLLDTRLEGEIEILGEGFTMGRSFFEASLVSDDGQTLHIYEGQLKEVENAKLEIGRRYQITFRPFVNNRWLELKIARLVPSGPRSP